MDIVERLRSVGGIEGTTRWYINPDGPEAADEIERLREALEVETNLSQSFANQISKQTLENKHLWDALKKIYEKPLDAIEIASATLEKLR